jgi:hypothetical protein
MANFTGDAGFDVHSGNIKVAPLRGGGAGERLYGAAAMTFRGTGARVTGSK